MPSSTAFGIPHACCRHLLLGRSHPFLTALLFTAKAEPADPTSDLSNWLKQCLQLLAVLVSACANVKWQ